MYRGPFTMYHGTFNYGSDQEVSLFNYLADLLLTLSSSFSVHITCRVSGLAVSYFHHFLDISTPEKLGGRRLLSYLLTQASFRFVQWNVAYNHHSIYYYVIHHSIYYYVIQKMIQFWIMKYWMEFSFEWMPLIIMLKLN